MKYLFFALTVLFVYLRLTSQIGWSWWWVTAPVWGYLVFSVVTWFLALSYLLVFGSPLQKMMLKQKYRL